MKTPVRSPLKSADLRRQAENQVTEAKPPDGLVDAQRLYHELQVHQAELEIQNEELQAAKLEAEAMLDRYTRLFDFAPIPYLTLEKDSRIRQANRAATALLGKGETLIQKRLSGFVGDSSQSEFEAFLARVFSSGDKQTCELSVKANEQAAYFVLHGSADPSGQSCLVALLDINERKQAEQARQAADRRKDKFLATLAHELRNPLTPINLGIQTLRCNQDNPAFLARVLDMMENQLGHMVKLIDGLLDLSRMNFGKIELHKTAVELAEVVRQAVESSKPLIDQAGHAFHCRVPAEPIRVEADLTRLAQAISNLLNNAAKFTAPGGHIKLNVEQCGQEALIRIQDDGIGIRSEMADSIFDLFVQGDPPPGTSPGGLGIGLSLVKQLVELHGGNVEMHSEGLGKGCEFLIRLPIVDSSRQQQSDVAAGPADEVAIPAKRRILITDDNLNVLQGLQFWLESLGHEVFAAQNGTEAIEAATRHRPDLMLLDIGMPGLNGYEVCRRIRQEAWGRDIVIIALTGWGRDQDRKQSQEAGFDHHLVKPVDFHLLKTFMIAH
jgi:signal transduction histidine kinase